MLLRLVQMYNLSLLGIVFSLASEVVCSFMVSRTYQGTICDMILKDPILLREKGFNIDTTMVFTISEKNHRLK
jgi:hypothetical protein